MIQTETVDAEHQACVKRGTYKYLSKKTSICQERPVNETKETQKESNESAKRDL